MAIGTCTLRLGQNDHGRLVSAEEFASAKFDEPWKYERVKGRLLVRAPGGTGHIRASNPWRDRLIIFQHTNPGVIEEVVGNAWVRPEKGDRYGDIGVYLVGRPFRVPENAPDLMFEIVSPGRESHDRDYVEKRAEYHALGIPEYVIVDRFNRTVTVLTHAPEGYEERILGESDVYTTPVLPGLAISLAEVF